MPIVLLLTTPGHGLEGLENPFIRFQNHTFFDCELALKYDSGKRHYLVRCTLALPNSKRRILVLLFKAVTFPQFAKRISLWVLFFRAQQCLPQSLFTGALGPELYNKLRDEMKAKGLINAGNCQTGIKIVFNYGKKKLNRSGRHRPRRIVEGGCIIILKVRKPIEY